MDLRNLDLRVLDTLHQRTPAILVSETRVRTRASAMEDPMERVAFMPVAIVDVE